MPRFLVCLGMMLGGSLRLAANGDSEVPPAESAVNSSMAQLYAQQLNVTIAMIAEQYVRPVARSELVNAALKGLYEAARVPIPGSLRAEADKATTEQEIVGLLYRVRESLGDPEALQGHQALLVSLQSMMRVLDPHSGLVSGADLARGNGLDLSPRVGLEVAENGGGGPLVVKAVVPGGPAQKAGILPGDQVTRLNGKTVEGLTSAQVQQVLTSPQGVVQANTRASQVRLELIRPTTSKSFKVSLPYETFQPETVLGIQRLADNSWDYFIDRNNKIAQLRISNLGTNTSVELNRELTRLKAAGMRGLILDLRWCPGGWLQESVSVADLLLDEGTIATVITRGGVQQEHLSVREGSFLGFAIVVLVNGETSGGAELIAAALQDNKRAVVAGQRTVGKGSIQNQRAVSIPNTGIKFTTGTFQRPNGKSIHRFPDSKPSDDWGVRPEPGLEFRVSPELNRQLRDWWLLQTLRPGSCNDVLPLDDPVSDPQRQAALKALLAMIK